MRERLEHPLLRLSPRFERTRRRRAGNRASARSYRRHASATSCRRKGTTTSSFRSGWLLHRKGLDAIDRARGHRAVDVPARARARDSTVHELRVPAMALRSIHLRLIHWRSQLRDRSQILVDKRNRHPVGSRDAESLARLLQSPCACTRIVERARRRSRYETR
jgi:hypothetical protein